MSLVFNAVDFDHKKKEVVKCFGTAKAEGFSGMGMPGVYMSLDRPRSMIPMNEFCEIIRYFMENTDLQQGDPRLKLLEDLKKTKKVKGYNGSRTRRLDVPRDGTYS